MKITNILCLPLWGGVNRNYTFVLVETDSGLTGIGEAGLAHRERAVCAAIEHLRDEMVGEDAARIEHLWQLGWRGGFFPGGAAISAALAAVDMALWDIKGKALGAPVYELLGGKVRDVVTCYTHVAGDANDPRSLVEACVQLKEAGWPAIRLCVPPGKESFEPRAAVRAALTLMESARAALGDEIELILDCHTRLGMAEAVLLCRELEPLRPLFVEDPLRSENLDSYRQLRARTGVPLAAGEQLSSKWQFRPLIEQELIDHARVDLAVAGGFTEARKISALCETHGVSVSVHNPLGPVATAAAAHFNIACPVFGIQELPWRHGVVLPEVFSPQYPAGEPYLEVADAPGLGVTADLEAAARFPPRWTAAPRLYRSDGAFTNW